MDEKTMLEVGKTMLEVGHAGQAGVTEQSAA
jgi:hypothetical protein